MPNTFDTSRKVVLTSPLKHYVDLNTDFGQSRDREIFAKAFDKTAEGNEEKCLLTYVTSVNIPGCVHDGSPKEAMDLITVAKSYNCAIGAHIGYPDPKTGGYEKMNLSPEELSAWIYLQVGGLRTIARALGTDIDHVRPHGALYSAFFNDAQTARIVAEALYKIDPWLFLVAPAGPILSELETTVGSRIAPEIYLGKRYSDAGLPVQEKFHENMLPQAILDQVKQLTTDGTLTSEKGVKTKVAFKSLHISPRLEDNITVAEKIFQLLGQPTGLKVAAVAETGWV